MSNLAKRPILDPEFEAVYQAEVVPRESNSKPAPSNQAAPERDALLELKAIAEANQAEYIDRRELSGFDQVEHDLSNIGRVCWNFVTRD